MEKKVRTFLLITLIKYISCQWIDPHDMNTNAKEKYMKSTTLKRSSSTSSINNGEIIFDSEVCFSHYKRIIGKLMNSAHIDKRDPAIYHGHIRFNIDPNDFEFLMAFGKEDLALDKLRKLDTIFSESFKRSFINEYLDEIESFQLKLYSIVVNVHNLWLLGTAFLLYIIYQLFKNNFPFAYIVKYLIILVFICDFGFRYQYLLEEAEEHNLSVAYSTKCDPAKMSWGEWTKFWFSNKDCERRTVTPLDAFLYQVKNIIIVPLHALGTGMGGFGHNMFTTLPWGLNLIMWPLMLIFAIIVFIFTMVICTGQAIEFNIFHLIKLKFGGTRSAQNENILTGTALEKLMDRCLHRPMVQNINVSVPSGDNKGDETKESTSTAAIQDNPDTVTSCNKTKSICNKSDGGKNNEMNEFQDIEISAKENQSQLSSNVKSESENSKAQIVVEYYSENNSTEDAAQDNSTESEIRKCE